MDEETTDMPVRSKEMRQCRMDKQSELCQSECRFLSALASTSKSVARQSSIGIGLGLLQKQTEEEANVMLDFPI